MPCPYNFPQKGKDFQPKDVITLLLSKKGANPLPVLSSTFFQQALITLLQFLLSDAPYNYQRSSEIAMNRIAHRTAGDRFQRY